VPDDGVFSQKGTPEVIALCDVNEERLKKMGAEAEITKLYVKFNLAENLPSDHTIIC